MMVSTETPYWYYKYEDTVQYQIANDLFFILSLVFLIPSGSHASILKALVVQAGKWLEMLF